MFQWVKRYVEPSSTDGRMEQQLTRIFGDAAKLNQVKVVPYLESTKEDYYGWVDYKNILAQSDYERLTEESYTLQNNECNCFYQ